MNKITFTVVRCIVLSYLVVNASILQANSDHTESAVDARIENRILSLGSSVDVQYNAEVKKRINQYTVKQRKTSEILLGRGNMYFPTFEAVLTEKGLPLDLKYLAVVESGLRPHVTSRTGAAGMWQFMRPTGRMMGLKINRTIDERRDVEKSTRAAADYLIHLHEQFQDWTLALAAYNCGPGNLRKAIRRSGGKRNFWEIKQYLPKETRQYIPKFIATSYMMSYYYEHDLTPQEVDPTLLNVAKARVFEKINLKELSKELSVDIETVKQLNPSYVRNYIPHSKEGIYTLVLPLEEMKSARFMYSIAAELPEETVREELPEPRPSISVIGLADHNSIKRAEEHPQRVLSIYAQPVRMGNEEEVDHHPEVYRIDERKDVINHFGHIISQASKTM